MALTIDDAATVRRTSPSPPASSAASDGTGRPLLVVLHGYGASERDLLPLWPHLGFDGETVFLRAPLALGPGAWAWFPLPSLEAIELPSLPAVREAADALLSWLAAHAAGRRVVLAGFSQGSTVALQALRTAPELVAGVVVLSGFVAGVGDAATAEDDARLAALDPRVPAFFGHGTADPVIPPVATELTGEWLTAHTDLVERAYPGLPHAIDGTELADVRAFLAGIA
ncbi:phospholipase/carboxylesterase [Salana multivorans]|uniref:Phospholipase/carboxylesterase n=1 Tax=Salana multivorans TaxID=120377 RepID=A0A3N2DDK1_9MICO|nr:alpha/beta hydrolase-fold protein [Salana multivorans]ROR97738.1 phospholipase/carboxylesterase [Salana multivorans]